MCLIPLCITADDFSVPFSKINHRKFNNTKSTLIDPFPPLENIKEKERLRNTRSIFVLSRNGREDRRNCTLKKSSGKYDEQLLPY